MNPCLQSRVLPNLLFSYSDSENPEEAMRNPCKKYQNESDAKLLEIPQLEDLDGAASGLIRLQEIYKLYPEDITKETFLNADEAYNVGLVAYDEEKFQHAFLWFLYSLDRLTEYSNTEEELLHYLSSSGCQNDRLSVAIYFSQELLNLDPSNDESRAQLNRLLHLQRNPDIFTLNTGSSNYEALCRGEVDERSIIFDKIRSPRDGYNTGGGNPRLMYAPVKEEVEWDKPRIIRYHDIISDREIEFLKNISRPQVNIEHTQTHTLDQIAQLYGKTKDLLKVFSRCTDAENVETTKSVLLNLLLSYSENPEEAMRNPVAAYRQLRQLRNDLIFIEKHIKPDLYQFKEYQDELNTKLLEIPQLEVLDGAASGLIRLQEIYKLHPEDITKETSLNVDEAYHVGLVTYDEHKFQHAFLWFLYSLDRLTEYSNTDEEELLNYLSSSAYHFGSLPAAIYFKQRLLNLDPSNDEVRVQLNWLLYLQSNPDISTLNTESSNYEALCRGEISKRQRALSCRYSTGGGNPRLMYAPVKEEVEWDEPRIIRYHDIISDREIEFLKNISRSQMSDVEIGGATVFPKVGVALQPEKGSAVFWYNLHKNGTLDLKTEHAGCPVLMGNKWVEDRIHHAGMDGLLRNCATGCRVDEAFTMDDLVDSISADTSGLRCGHVQLRIVFITPLFEEEKDLLESFSLYIDAEEKNVKRMKSILLALQLLTYFDPEYPEKTMRDPVAAYKLLIRVRSEWLTIVEITQQSHYEKYQKLLAFADIPELEDVDGAASELIRLQEFYKLYPHNITKETSLDADQAYNVGLVAYDEDKFQYAFLWFLYSLDRLTEYSTTTEEELLHFLSSSAYHFGSLPAAIYFQQRLLNLDPANDEFKVELSLYKLLRFQRTSNPDIFTLNTKSKNLYEALCRGETSKRQRALSCRYSTGGGNPRLMYAPVKEEVEWDEPRIIRYHDIISDREIEFLKNISRPQLSRSMIRHLRVSNLRTSQSVFLEEDNTVLAHISQNIADITGLSMESAEYLHMSDVEIGGATVFPEVGVALKPKKGSAMFWYNLQKNGRVDYDTQHAGCPVLVGNKWVANKWIHEFGQEFRRPCSLSDWE
ncbi:Prolyl 4-hydroxylase subunit alpha-2 [Anabarilius grahami]|uniref:Prolyl 4-hydroxylase subunit alpha-2 n=1 Tax=Anabarilius grahami TaxID=495550 RepID=A0A3N0Z1D8_ANAGA|nr:Prolyl 4-hydroxylase subunit alpha-2 [Anabarilius grahami]